MRLIDADLLRDEVLHDNTYFYTVHAAALI